MEALATMLQEHIDAGTLPGAVAVRWRGGHTETVALGLQDVESETPMAAETLFFWDSLSKPLTAALALGFVADGILDLDSPIAQWLPELSEPRVLQDPSGPLQNTVTAHRPVTVEDLLTLRGGLGFTTDFESPFADALISTLQEGRRPRGLDRDDFLTAAAQLPLAHQPGQGWTYNTGSTLLGLLLERLADQPLDELMRQRLTEPLGMQDARWWVPAAERPRFAAQYRPTDDAENPLKRIDPAEGTHYQPPSFPDGAGGLIGTAADWLAFGRMLLAGGVYQGAQILPTALVRSMMTDQLSTAQCGCAGFFLTNDEGWGYGGSVRADGTFGWAGGAGTTARVDPRNGQVAILLTQSAVDGPQGSPVLDAFENLTHADKR